ATSAPGPGSAPRRRTAMKMVSPWATWALRERGSRILPLMVSPGAGASGTTSTPSEGSVDGPGSGWLVGAAAAGAVARGGNPAGRGGAATPVEQAAACAARPRSITTRTGLGRGPATLPPADFRELA